MNFKNLLTCLYVRKRYDNLTVKTAGTQKRLIKNIRTVGRRHYYNAFVFLKAVHLY